MMGVAENISDLRDLLSIVAEETGALRMDDADEDSVGWTTEGPLPMTFGHVRRARTALAALEAALSTDAEAVKLSDDERRIGVIRSSVETGNDGKPDSRVSVKQYQDNDSLITISMFMGNHQWIEGSFTAEDAAKIASVIIAKPAVAALYAEPVKTAPAVAVKALKAWEAWEAKLILEGSDDLWDELGDLTDLQALRNAALSAQVQDVAVAEIVSAHGDPEAFGERELVALVDIQKFPYRTKLYAASPASKHGDAE